jgi:hypothetical protein
MRCSLVLLACVALLGGGASAAPWYTPGNLSRRAEAGAAHADMLLLVAAVRLSYVATHGSYYNPADANATLPGGEWARSPVQRNPAFGFHALTFVNAAQRRVLVAFRGTDLDVSHASGACDVCADQMLWQGTAVADLPAMCAPFNASTLDYWGEARAMVQTIATTYDGYDVLFTGHSLGAGLSNLMAALTDARSPCRPHPTTPDGPVASFAGAAVFSTPEYITTLQNRSAVDVSRIDVARFAMFADAYDPIFTAARLHAFGGMAALVCEWHDGAPSAQCLACEAQQRANVDGAPSVQCVECMFQRHVFKHYEEIVYNATVRPVCHDVQECLVGFECPSRGSC